MKITTVVKGSIFAAALGVACLLPVTTHAQADVSPDVYEVVSTETIAAEHQLLVAANTAKPADFQGRFALPYEVRCKGKSLKSGQYALTVKSEGTARVVTITRNGETMNIRAQELTGNPAANHSTVLVRKSHDGAETRSGVRAAVERAALPGHECHYAAWTDGAAADFVELSVRSLARTRNASPNEPRRGVRVFASNDLISCRR